MEVKRSITLESKIYNTDVSKILDEYMKLHCFLCRKLYSILFNLEKKDWTKELLNKLQRDFVSAYNIKVREYKSVLIQVKGMISSQEELLKLRKTEIKTKIEKTKSKLNKVKKVKKIDWNEKEFLERKLNRLNQKLSNLKLKPILFGSKELFNSQFHSKQDSHDTWLSEWRDNRDNQIYIVGSRTESYGNQLCQLHSVNKCRITLPDCIIEKLGLTSKHLNLDVKFFSVKEKKQKRYSWLQQAVDNHQPLCIRIIRKNENYYLQVSLSQEKEIKEQKEYFGSVGYDLNHGIITYCLVKPDGNPSEFVKETYDPDKTSLQLDNDLSAIADKIVALAEKNNAFITRENIDLEKKKSEDNGVVSNKKIHSIPTNKFTELMESKCFVKGVLLKPVHPAYTSVSAKFKYAPVLGRSTHDCATLTIGRRGLGFRERVPFSVFSLVSREEGSEKIRKKHNWSQWFFVNKKGIGFLKKKSPHVLQTARKAGYGDDLSNALSSLFSIQTKEKSPDSEAFF